MANRQKGEVGFELDGVEYTLSFSINALCELEDAMGASVQEFAPKLANGVDMRTARLLVWAGMRDHHEEVTVKEAGRIASAYGLPEIMGKITDAFQLAFPEEPASGKKRKAAG